jgi:D-alanyl-D-alanine carboxypeptidase (penicillin-binding protein 5/6)
MSFFTKEPSFTSLHDQVLVEKPLIALNEVKEGSFVKKLMDQVKLLFNDLLSGL